MLKHNHINPLVHLSAVAATMLTLSACDAQSPKEKGEADPKTPSQAVTPPADAASKKAVFADAYKRTLAAWVTQVGDRSFTANASDQILELKTAAPKWQVLDLTKADTLNGSSLKMSVDIAITAWKYAGDAEWQSADFFSPLTATYELRSGEVKVSPGFGIPFHALNKAQRSEVNAK